MFDLNRVANDLGSSYSALFISVPSQHKRIPRYRSAFLGGLETARKNKYKRMPVERLNCLLKIYSEYSQT